MQSEKVNLRDFLTGKSKLGEIKEIIIPDIQRDYVMGSGGKKLESLFREMDKHKEEFNFSCIMGYKDNDNIFYIYDGQQRLVTLLYLVANLSNTETNNTYIEQIKKFSFMARKSANEYLQSLLEGEKVDICIDDYTTFSIQNLINCFGEQKYLSIPTEGSNIDIEYLMEKVYFELVSVEKVGDAEQFFMDLNDGLDLEDYEIFKAELYHKSKQIPDIDFKAFALSMENEWLRFFRNYKPNDSGSEWYEEEIEILFIKFCFYMIWIEEGRDIEKYDESNIDWIEKKHLKKVEEIINNIVNLEINTESCSCVNYSFGLRNRECANNTNGAVTRSINSVDGVFWNLGDEQYSSMLNVFLKSFYENKKDTDGNNVKKIKEETKYDAVIWGYISNLDKEIRNLQHYLRNIKIFLNRNIVRNDKVFYSEINEIWYAKYSAYGIPSYYSKIEDSFASFSSSNETFNNNSYLQDVIILNKQFSEDKGKFETRNDRLREAIASENKKYLLNCYEEIKKIENLSYINGFVESLLDDYGNPIITSELLQEKIFVEENKSVNIKNFIKKLLSEFSCICLPELEMAIFEKSLKITWLAYTNNVSCYDPGEVPLQTITDMFINKRLKNVIRLWIYGINTKFETFPNDKILFMGAQRYIPTKGWIGSIDQVVYVNDYYDSRGTYIGLCSSNATSVSPYTSYNLKDYINRLDTAVNLNECEIDIKNSIEYQMQQDWWVKKLESTEIYYCSRKWMYYVLLDEYTRRTYNGEQEIKKMATDNMEIVRECYGRNFFIPNPVISEYVEKYIYTL